MSVDRSRTIDPSPSSSRLPSALGVALGRVMLTTALLTAACGESPYNNGDTKDQPSTPSTPSAPLSATPSVTPDTPAADTADPIEAERRRINLPSITPLDQSIDYPKPTEITVDDEQYRVAAELFTSRVSTELVPKLQRSFEAYPEAVHDPRQRGAILIKFINKCAQIVNQDPALKPLLLKYQDGGGKTDVVELARALKPIFFRGGLYFDMKYAIHEPDSQSMILEMMIYDVQSTELVQVSDGNFTTEVPVVTIGQRGFDLDEFSSPGLQDVDMNLALMFSENSSPGSKLDSIVEAGIITEKPLNASQAIAEYDDDTRVHEATHVFISEKYPEISINTSGNYFQLALPIPLGNSGQVAQVVGVYMLPQVHELAAVGNEIAQSEQEFPLTQIMYYSDPGHTYQLVSQLIIPLTIQALPEGPDKDELIEMISRGYLNTATFLRKALPHLDSPSRLAIGTTMYKIADRIIEGIRSGEIQVQTTPN